MGENEARPEGWIPPSKEVIRGSFGAAIRAGKAEFGGRMKMSFVGNSLPRISDLLPPLLLPWYLALLSAEEEIQEIKSKEAESSASSVDVKVTIKQPVLILLFVTLATALVTLLLTAL